MIESAHCGADSVKAKSSYLAQSMTVATHRHCRIGAWTALTIFILNVIYILTGAVWFATEKDPILRQALTPTDPHLAILEAIIVLTCPLMVLTMVSVHAFAPRHKSSYSLAGLSFMILLAGETGSIHFVDLVAIRRIDPQLLSMLSPIVSLPWRWPSAVFALDLLAWDLFFGFSMLFAAQVFEGGRLETSIRRVMSLSGALCVLGILGPTLGKLRFQAVAIVGYGALGTVAFFLLFAWFSQRESSSVELDRV
jgi:hypothetical protein